MHPDQGDDADGGAAAAVDAVGGGDDPIATYGGGMTGQIRMIYKSYCSKEIETFGNLQQDWLYSNKRRQCMEFME